MSTGTVDAIKMGVAAGKVEVDGRFSQRLFYTVKSDHRQLLECVVRRFIAPFDHIVKPSKICIEAVAVPGAVDIEAIQPYRVVVIIDGAAKGFSKIRLGVIKTKYA